MRRSIACATLAAALALALPASAEEHVTLPDGATIARVPVGGLDASGARHAVEQALGRVYERPITVRVGSRDQRISTRRAGQTIEYAAMIDRAFRLAAVRQPVHVRLDRDYDGKALTRAAVVLGRPFYRAPRDARVRFGITRVVRIRARRGRGLDTAALRKALFAELRRPTPQRIVRAGVRSIRPRISTGDLRRLYPAYLSVDRRHFKLRLFKRLRHVRTYPIAVGMAGHDTPPGLRRVLWKELNPTWHVPNSPWAGSLAGQTVPPGSPSNPLKYAFIALGDGVGIHGTAEDWSIGSRASHGCIRMHVSDIKRLYPRVPVGTPVLIR